MLRQNVALKSLPVIHILLVEDSPSDAFVVENQLGDHTSAVYRIFCAKTESEAVAALAAHTFDVCLLDLSLPDVMGFSALISIQEKAPEVPLLILTGVKDMTLARHAVSRGAQDYLLKDEMEPAALTRAIDYAMERKRAEKDLFQRANCDALTGLANRELFLNRLDMALARCERTGTSVALLFIDLNHFKQINDVHGHEAGDEILKTVAHRIRTGLRPYDTSARFGGDEFTVLLESINSPRDAANIAQKIIRSLAAPIAYRDRQLEAAASIGIAYTSTPVTSDMLLQYADIAMYHAKKDGSSAYRFYSEQMHEETQARLTMEEDLRRALPAGELQLHYQPYLTTNGKLLGVESLLRWAHPARGLLCASEFLTAAESARIMHDIIRWTCTQLRNDRVQLDKHPSLSVTLNLSTSQLDIPGVVSEIVSLAQDNVIPATQLAIDIPEATAANLSHERITTLKKLHGMGIELHLDRFGVGSLPLLTLCALPFSLLKIDMSLVRNMSTYAADNVPVSAAFTLAHHLGMQAGAVGIESQWQSDTLKTSACDIMQGHHLCPPMTAPELSRWLESRA